MGCGRIERIEHCGGAGGGDLASEVHVGGHRGLGVAELIGRGTGGEARVVLEGGDRLRKTWEVTQSKPAVRKASRKPS